MCSNYLLTIAIPTYNRENFLKRSLQSVIKQNDERVEILISDNASSDGTKDVVASACAQCDNITYIRNAENIGPDANFLQCFEKATGKFVLLLGDDDIVAEGNLNKLLNFLGNDGKDCSLIFVNHTGFSNENGVVRHYKPFLNDEQSFVTDSKSRFLNSAKGQLTYMSSFILAKSAFSSVKDPIKHNGTSFIHSCIAFEAMNGQSLMGVVCEPCISQDLSQENTGYPQCLVNVFRVFGRGMEYAYCTVAPQFGFPAEQCNRIYEDYISKSWRGVFLTLKACRIKGWKEQYRQYGKPVLEKHKRAKRKLGIYLHCPKFIAVIIYKVIRPVYKKLKN